MSNRAINDKKSRFKAARRALIFWTLFIGLGASVYEVKSTEKTDGTLGFWWCGR